MNSFLSNLKSGEGFTLIELLVVIAIVALLSSVVLVAVSNTRMKARDARRIADLNQITKALDVYFQTYGYYPPGSSSEDAHQNYLVMRALLNSAKILDFKFETSYRDSIFMKRAQAGFITVTGDPNLRYEYVSSGEMTGLIPTARSYRLRAKLETNHQALRQGLTGVFRNSGEPTGDNACDISFYYYCVGNPGAFIPRP
jgi:prepilin-type N-terminal cleavage/methylation domain-containing protein